MEIPRYTDLAGALAALRELPLTFEPAATEGELAALQAAVGEADIAPVLALYRDHNGFTDDGWPVGDARFQRHYGTRFTLMPVAEVLETYRAIREDWFETPEEAALYTNLLPLWTDSANYQCYILSGPLQGRMGFLWHEEPFFIQPLFRDIPALVSDLVREIWTGENAFDYPSTAPRPEWDKEDVALCEKFMALYLTTENPILQQNAGGNATFLCPPERLELLHPLRETARNMDDYDYQTLLRHLEKRV